MPLVSLTVNGSHHSVEVEGRTLLVELLRDKLGLTGTHVGCDTSQCGACVVHVDGSSVKSCAVLALQAEGASVTTIEGLAAPDGTLHPMQAAFREHHALQCGFCTPGMVMSARRPAGAAPGGPDRAGNPRGAGGQSLPLYRLPQHCPRHRRGAGRAAPRRRSPSRLNGSRTMYDFDYRRPATLAEAVSLLADPEAKALAGGQTFIPVLKQRLNRPSMVLDLAGLRLDGIRRDGDRITVGAMATHRAIASSAEIGAAIPGLARMAGWIGDTQVRNRGTIGGSLANNDPSACYPAAVLALGATIRTDRREIAADEYFLGMFATALEPDELITAISFPVPARSNYEKFRNPASRYAVVGVFVADGPAGLRVAVTGAGQGGVFRHTAMETALARHFSPDAIKHIATPADDLVSDIHAGAAFRAHLIGVMAARAIAGA